MALIALDDADAAMNPQQDEPVECDERDEATAWRLGPIEAALLLTGLCAVVVGLTCSERRPGPTIADRSPSSAGVSK